MITEEQLKELEGQYLVCHCGMGLNEHNEEHDFVPMNDDDIVIQIIEEVRRLRKLNTELMEGKLNSLLKDMSRTLFMKMYNEKFKEEEE